MDKTLLTTVEEAISIAKKKGAKDAWAVMKQEREVECEYRDAKLNKVKDATSSSLSVRLFVDGRFSVNTTSDLRPKQLEDFFTQSIALAKALEKDPHRKITDPKLFIGAPKIQDLKLYDPHIAKLNQEQRKKICLKMNKILSGEKDILSSASSVSDTESKVVIASTNGFFSEYQTSTFGYHTEVSLKDGQKKPEDWDWASSRSFKGLPDAEEISLTALKRVRAQRGIKKGPTAKTFMLVDNRAAGRILSRLIQGADADDIFQKQSFWRGNIGKSKVSEKLTLIDNPLIEGGLGSRPFDREGIAAKKISIIEKGVFKNIYASTYGASKLGIAPTTGSRSNITLDLGAKSLVELAKEMTNGVYITAWLGGNMDATTGDFSMGVRGHEVKNGVIGLPIGEMNVTGNILDLFQRLVAVGNDPWKYSSIQAPSLLFEGVQFSGV